MTFWKRRSISVKSKALKVLPSFPCEAYLVANYSELINAFGFIWFMLYAAVSWHDRSAYYFTLDFNVSTYKSLN